MNRAAKQSSAAATARLVWRILTRSERRWMKGLLVLTLVGVILDTLSITLIIPAVALLTDPGFKERYTFLQPVFDALGDPSPAKLVVVGMFFLVGVYIVKNTFLGLTKYFQMRFQAQVEIRLSNQLFEIYLHQPYSFYLVRNSSELLRNLMDARAVTDYAITPVLLVLTELSILIGLATLLLVVQPLGSLAVVSTMGLAGYLFHRFSRTTAEKWGRERQFHDGERLKEAQHGFGGIKDVKILGTEAHFASRYREHSKTKVVVDQKFNFLQQLPILWLEVLVIFGLALLVSILVAQNKSAEDILPILAVFAAAAFRVLPSAQRTLNSLQGLRYGQSILRVVSDDLSLPIQNANTVDSSKIRVVPKIDIEDVSFRYQGLPKLTIRNVSLSIAVGQSIGFVGPSGAGKSTLIDLILGLLEPTTGKILVDGRDIAGDVRLWQHNIGYVPQSIFLTDDTLRANIAFGLNKNDIESDSISRALHAAQLSEFVESLPSGLDTIVGERGIRLSGGQRQRIGIARALYHNPPVLVLDEATSSLDLETESGVMDAVEQLHGEKTILIVAHRLSTVRRCDHLVLIDNGEVVVSGSFEQVMKVFRPADEIE